MAAKQSGVRGGGDAEREPGRSGARAPGSWSGGRAARGAAQEGVHVFFELVQSPFLVAGQRGGDL